MSRNSKKCFGTKNELCEVPDEELGMIFSQRVIMALLYIIIWLVNIIITELQSNNITSHISHSKYKSSTQSQN